MKGVKKRLLPTDQNHPAIRAYCKAVREGMKLKLHKNFTIELINHYGTWSNITITKDGVWIDSEKVAGGKLKLAEQTKE